MDNTASPTTPVVNPVKPAVSVQPAKPVVISAPVTNAKPSMANAVNAAQATRAMTPPKGLQRFNTRELKEWSYFHGCIYSETSARKSTTAAMFGTADSVRIILTRRKEQLIPLQEKGYEVALVEDAESLMYAMQYPEQIWPDWAKLKDRILVLDDATEAVAMLLESNSTIDGKVVKDRRRSYTAAGEDLREICRVALRKPQHFVMTALAKVKENSLTNEERIGPDLPPSMLNFLLTELEFVFYIKTSTFTMLTDRDFFAVKKEDPDKPGKDITYRREIFAKNKLPLEQKTLIAKEEQLDLLKLWQKIRGNQTKPVLPAAK